MKKKKIITLDEFFTYKRMFEGLPEDKALACELYNNADYADRDILDRLMAKALVFESRVKFCSSVGYTGTVDTIETVKIYIFVEREKVDKIYMDILKKLKELKN